MVGYSKRILYPSPVPFRLGFLDDTDRGCGQPETGRSAGNICRFSLKHAQKVTHSLFHFETSCSFLKPFRFTHQGLGPEFAETKGVIGLHLLVRFLIVSHARTF
jgi:hypothetical protein